MCRYTYEIFGTMHLASHLGTNLQGYLDSDKTWQVSSSSSALLISLDLSFSPPSPKNLSLFLSLSYTNIHTNTHTLSLSPLLTTTHPTPPIPFPYKADFLKLDTPGNQPSDPSGGSSNFSLGKAVRRYVSCGLRLPLPSTSSSLNLWMMMSSVTASIQAWMIGASRD